MRKHNLNKIYNKTDGNCHICHGKLTYGSYNQPTAKGGWEIEHSKPKFKRGTNHLNNLYPAHISCNRKKGVTSSRQARKKYGNSRAPYSKAKKNQISISNKMVGATIGLAATVAFGPVGRIVGATIGALIADEFTPKK